MNIFPTKLCIIVAVILVNEQQCLSLLRKDDTKNDQINLLKPIFSYTKEQFLAIDGLAQVSSA